jgi:hypothetical protein
LDGAEVLYVKTRAVKMPPGETAKWQARNGAYSLYREIDTQEMGDRIAPNHLR